VRATAEGVLVLEIIPPKAGMTGKRMMLFVAVFPGKTPRAQKRTGTSRSHCDWQVSWFQDDEASRASRLVECTVHGREGTEKLMSASWVAGVFEAERIRKV
jgi:hypothetical protein